MSTRIILLRNTWLNLVCSMYCVLMLCQVAFVILYCNKWKVFQIWQLQCNVNLSKNSSKIRQKIRNQHQVFTNALSFYRSQNVLCWSKFFVLDQKFIYILCQLKRFCARPIDDLHSVKLVFWAGTKVYEEALNAIKFLDWLQTFGPAQSTRTRHK